MSELEELAIARELVASMLPHPHAVDALFDIISLQRILREMGQ